MPSGTRTETRSACVPVLDVGLSNHGGVHTSAYRVGVDEEVVELEALVARQDRGEAEHLPVVLDCDPRAPAVISRASQTRTSRSVARRTVKS
jgi:hypothetical protein